MNPRRIFTFKIPDVLDSETPTPRLRTQDSSGSRVSSTTQVSEDHVVRHIVSVRYLISPVSSLPSVEGGTRRGLKGAIP